MPRIQRKDLDTATENFVELCQRHQDLFIRKNAQYGNTIVTTGVLGASIELIGAVMRLPQLVLKDKGMSRDMNTLLDILKSRKDLSPDIQDLVHQILQNASIEGHGSSNVKALKNVFADIHNYANIALMMLEDENWDGI